MNKAHQYRPITYFVITFLVTFALWFGGAYFSFQDGKEGLHMLFMLPGLMAPFIISTVMIFTSNDAELKKKFFSRLINLKMDKELFFSKKHLDTAPQKSETLQEAHSLS